MTVSPVFHVLLYHPEIPPNTGNVIRLCANTGARLHLIEPLGFDIDNRQLKRAGLDYRDRSLLFVHDDLDTALEALQPARVICFTATATTLYTEVSYRPGDVLMFGPEPAGIAEQAPYHPAVTMRVRLPMLPGNRSLNLASAAAVGVYEAWRQLGFDGAQDGLGREVELPPDSNL